MVLELEPLIVQQEAALERLGLRAVWHALCQLATRTNKTPEKEEAKKSTADAAFSLSPSEQATDHQTDQHSLQVGLERSMIIENNTDKHSQSFNDYNAGDSAATDGAHW